MSAKKLPQLQPGEIGDKKRRWIDEGCLPPASDNEADLRKFEERALAGKYSRSQLAEIRSRALSSLERRQITDGIAVRVLHILDNAVPKNLTADFLENIATLRDQNLLTDEAKSLIRDNAACFLHDGDITPEEFQRIMTAIELDCIKA